MPREQAIFTNPPSTGTVLSLLIASASGTKSTFGGMKSHHRAIVAFLDGLQSPDAIGQSQLPVDGGRRAAPDPGAHDHRKGLLGKLELQPFGHGLGCFSRSPDDVLTRITGRQR